MYTEITYDSSEGEFIFSETESDSDECEYDCEIDKLITFFSNEYDKDSKN